VPSKSKGKGQKNPGGRGDAIEAAMFVEMFGKTVATHIELTSKMDMLCTELRENTKATNKLLGHLGALPEVLGKVKGTVGLIKWGLIPVILSLIGLVCFLASK